MGHNLNIVEGKASMAYVNQVPWHGLGTRVPGEAMTAAQALEASRLNFEATKQPLFIVNAQGQNVELRRKVAVVRQDTHVPLGIVGKRYEVLQNRDAFGFFDAIVGEGQAIYETVGALGDGEMIWILAKLPNDIVVNNIGVQDVSKLYLLLTNSHDGSSCVTARLTPVRVVCQNTLNIATAGGIKTVYVRHTRNVKEKLAEAHKLMGIIGQQVNLVTQIYNQFAQIEATKDIQKVYLDRLFEIEQEQEVSTRTMNAIAAVHSLFKNGSGTSGQTLWHLYNGTTEWVDHHRNLRSTTVRFENTVFGSGFGIKERAFEIACDIAGVQA